MAGGFYAVVRIGIPYAAESGRHYSRVSFGIGNLCPRVWDGCMIVFLGWTCVLMLTSFGFVVFLRTVSGHQLDYDAVETALLVGFLMGWLSYGFDPNYPKSFFRRIGNLLARRDTPSGRAK